ncbi:MAG: hypothetical protein GY822_24980 [Deltaproteobacteria bacterium]|nr:hypothetical protein [Deltaproteobacteria bacterium]
MPSDLRREEDGTLDFDRWPGRWESDLLTMWLRASNTRMKDGYGLSAGAFVQLSAAVDEDTLPQKPEDTLGPDAVVYIVNIDENSAFQGERIPLDVVIAPVDPYTPENPLAARPVFGFTRRANTQYAFVVTEGLQDATGTAVGASEELINALNDLVNANSALVEHLSPLAKWLDDEDSTKRK